MAVVAIVVGIGARGWVVAHRGSLFLDEASLALNVLARGFAGLTRPLDWGQAAPIGYLWIVRALSVLFGASEIVLRALPFVAGVLTLPLTWLVGRRVGGAWTGAFATVALSCSLVGVFYGADAKPYASDAFVATALVWLTLRTTEAPASRGRWWAVGVLGAAGMVMSLPAVFTLGAAGAALAMSVGVRHARTRMALWACVAGWLTVFAAIWFGGLRTAAHESHLQEYWAPAMLDLQASTIVARVVRTLATVAAAPLGASGSVALMVAAIGAWLVGLVTLARVRPVVAVLLGGPVLLGAVGSMAGVYAMLGRLAYFCAPLALIVFGVALDQARQSIVRPFGRNAPKAGLVAGVVIATALAWGAGSAALHLVTAPASLEPTHDLFASVEADAARTDTPVYLYARAVPAWIYATTDWHAPDRERLDRFRALAGDPESPAYENLGRERAVAEGEGDTLVITPSRPGAAALTGPPLELVGLAPGIRYRILGPMGRDHPSPGWAASEAQRLVRVAHPDVWLVASHFFEGTERDELRPLLGAVRGAGLVVAEERRGGKDAVALRLARR